MKRPISNPHHKPRENAEEELYARLPRPRLRGRGRGVRALVGCEDAAHKSLEKDSSSHHSPQKLIQIDHFDAFASGWIR